MLIDFGKNGTCPVCDGKGKVRVAHCQVEEGIPYTCSRCDGTGQVSEFSAFICGKWITVSAVQASRYIQVRRGPGASIDIQDLDMDAIKRSVASKIFDATEDIRHYICLMCHTVGLFEDTTDASVRRALENMTLTEGLLSANALGIGPEIYR